MKILLVEDSATLRHAMSQYVTEAGHTPLIAESGEQALQMLEDTPVDMIIMDVEMPGLNGFETTSLIREWLGSHWIPIIFVTGKSDDEDYQKGIEAGGDDYLIKPVSKMIILAKIRAMERITDMRDQLNKLNAELEALSQLDGLTQTLNRRAFNHQAEQQWLLAQRQQSSTAVLMIDVDHFKPYNDHYGHPAGDKVLRQVSDTIRSCLHRPYDLLGRYGGEEFVVLLPDTDIKGATQVSECIKKSITALNILHERSSTANYLTVSIGAACCQQTQGYQLEDVIKAADRSLYRAKHAGRNQHKIEEMVAHCTVLIAHSDRRIQQVISTALMSDFNIVTADSADEALELAVNIRPELIIMESGLSNTRNKMLTEQLRLAARTRNSAQLHIGDIEKLPEPLRDTASILPSAEATEDLLSTARALLK
ncbi:MAG TPA: diguanylate cyclase [Cellvibrionaceae bacterium]